MEYTISKLAKLAGISTRALRFYDEIGILKPSGSLENGYRIYCEKEVDTLQQILFYKEMGIELSRIKDILHNPEFDREKALSEHLHTLTEKKSRIEKLITNVQNTIKNIKGEIIMNDKEKFEGFKDEMISENERKYGEEIRTKYGDEAVNNSYAKIKNMTQDELKEVEALSNELNETLKTAFEEGDPASALAQKACALHKQWLMFYWSSYSKEAHMGLAQMYVDDPRFTQYYDNIAPGSAEFLRDAIMIYCK